MERTQVCPCLTEGLMVKSQVVGHLSPGGAHLREMSGGFIDANSSTPEPTKQQNLYTKVIEYTNDVMSWMAYKRMV